MAQEESTLIKSFIKLSAGPSPIITHEDEYDRQVEAVSIPASLSAVGVAGQKYYLDDTLREWEEHCPTCKQKFPNLDDMLDHDIIKHRTKEATDPQVKWVTTKSGKKIPIKPGQEHHQAPQTPQPKSPANKPITLKPKGLMDEQNPLSLKPEELLPVDFDTANQNFQQFLATTKRQDYSFDPKTGHSFDAQNKAEAIAFHQRFSDGFNDVYVIGVTNHAGQLSRESQSAYEQVKNENKYPLIGHWVSQDTGFDYTDISYPIDHGTSEADAIALAKQSGQESIVAVTRRGTYRFVNVM